MNVAPAALEQFLNTMEAVVPWAELEALIEPHYPMAGFNMRIGKPKDSSGQ